MSYGFAQTGLMGTVFAFDADAKADMLNILQYAALSVVPVFGLHKLIQRLVPDLQLTKSSLELLFELCVQLVLVLLGFRFLHRLVTYVPTYSGVVYPDFNVQQITLLLVLLLCSMRSSFADKVSLLFSRAYDAWNGTDANAKPGNNNNGTNATNGNNTGHGPANTMRSDGFVGTSLSSLPMEPVSSLYQTANAGMGSNSDGRKQDMASGMMMMDEPVAANDYGGSSFGSSW